MKPAQPALFVPFGLPGAGKTYVAHVFESFGFFVHDGDDDLPEDMRTAIDASAKVTDEMRDAFFARIIEQTNELIPNHARLVVAQTFIKEKYRLLFLEHFPAARFLLVVADDDVRERRLHERTHQALDPDYARRMTTFFDPPHIPHLTIHNNVDGDSHIKRQISDILSTTE